MGDPPKELGIYGEWTSLIVRMGITNFKKKTRHSDYDLHPHIAKSLIIIMTF